MAKDEGRPFGTAMQVEVPNHRKLLRTKAVVVSVTEKAKRDFVRYVPMETNTSEPLINCRKRRNVIKTGKESLSRDESGGNLITDQTVTGMEAA